MAAVHTEAVAIFNGQLINEVEDKIQYIKYRLSQPFDSNTPKNVTIPGNSSQYFLLCESYMFVQCHMEETDQFGNPITTSNTPSTPAHSKRNVAKNFKRMMRKTRDMRQEKEMKRVRRRRTWNNKKKISQKQLELYPLIFHHILFPLLLKM